MWVFYRLKMKLHDVNRFFRRNWFKLWHGYNYENSWNLDQSLSAWVTPLLKHMRDHSISYPYDMTPEQWKEILSKMILAFELIAADDYLAIDNEDLEKNRKEIEDGLDLFRKHFHDLWD